MFAILIFCLMCYLLFVLSSLLFPLFLGIVAFFLILSGIKAIFKAFTVSARPLNRQYEYAQVIYTSRNPAIWLFVSMWQGLMKVLYQVVFTVTKAINDGKNS